MTPPHAPV
jgi:hypothetical protein